MNSPIGHTFLYNIIILFIFIIFAFLAATLSYYKAFKVNNRIIYSIEKYEGYNYRDSSDANGNPLDSSYEEMEVYLNSIGYAGGASGHECPATYNGMYLIELEDKEPTHRYCIYLDYDANTEDSLQDSDTDRPVYTEHYQIGVLTYMNINLPLIELLDFPVFTKTNRIYKFTTGVNDPNMNK